jgi:molecular chaperone GrpE
MDQFMEATERTGRPGDDDEPSETERLKEEVRREHDMYLRALADFDNYRRRVERERARAADSGKREVILSLLDVLDGFDNALRQAGGGRSSISEGVRLLHRKLLGLLETHGVTPFNSVGESFDPEKHEAVGSVETDEFDSGVIVEELQRGYRKGEEVLRPARVRVAE